MNRGQSNGRVNSMAKRLKAEWLAKVDALATLGWGKTFKVIPLATGKSFNGVPVDQIVERAKVKGYTANVRATNSFGGEALYLAIPVKVAVTKPKAA